MAQCDGTPIHIDPFYGNLQLPDIHKHLSSKGLVDLKEIDIVDSEAASL